MPIMIRDDAAASAQGLKLIHFSAQNEPFLKLNRTLSTL
jgi:hypothetical protein